MALEPDEDGFPVDEKGGRADFLLQQALDLLEF